MVDMREQPSPQPGPCSLPAVTWCWSMSDKLLLTHGPVARERAMADILPIKKRDSSDGSLPDVAGPQQPPAALFRDFLTTTCRGEAKKVSAPFSVGFKRPIYGKSSVLPTGQTYLRCALLVASISDGKIGRSGRDLVMIHRPTCMSTETYLSVPTFQSRTQCSEPITRTGTAHVLPVPRYLVQPGQLSPRLVSMPKGPVFGTVAAHDALLPHCRPIAFSRTIGRQPRRGTKFYRACSWRTARITAIPHSRTSPS